MVTVTMPIVGGEKRVMGVIAGRARAEILNELLHERTGLGESGKTYIVDANRLLMAHSLPIAESMVPEVPLQRMAVEGVAAALESKTNGSAIYEDYRSKQVIGVFRWLPEIRAMLFVEQDQSEAFGAIFTTLGISLVVALSALVLAVGLSLTLMRGIANPLENLAETATRIAAGDLDRYANVERDDEIGLLAQAFNSMTTQLRELIADLEHRVAERTHELRHLALQLETSAQVSREVTSILAIDTLLAKITELIESAFGYYAVHIYLVDQGADQLVFRASSNATPPHDLILDIGSTSLNGQVIRTNQAALVNDVTTEPRYLADRNFPATRAELVIPLRIGDRPIGTLDLLSAELDAFKPEDVLIAQSLGDQIAIAIENARLYERSQELAVLEERNRLAREFHDSMNQSLYSIVLFAGAAHKESEKAGLKSIQRHLTRVEDMAQQTLKEMRLMIYELRPRVLEQKGLVGALQQRLDAVEASVGMNAALVVDGEIALSPRAEMTVYRIVQEALNNALKHAAATSITVSIRNSADQIEVQVVDNGVGFDPADPARKAGLGLTSMRERADELGATLQIRSILGAGTGVSVLIHLAATADRPIRQEVSSQ